MTIKLSKKKLEQIKNSFDGKRIAVIGDMMLDSYFWGEVKRISPEAPVPVVEVTNEFDRFGGAANVALNIIKLGGIPIPIGVIGNDSDGEKFMRLMEEACIPSYTIIKSEKRPTTTKTRVIGGNQQIVRIDKESKEKISRSEENQILKFVTDNIDNLDAIILEDYNKGVLTKRVIKETIEIANSKNVIVTVDPKFHNFDLYKNVTVFKPNKKEAEDALQISIKTDDDIEKAGNLLLERMGAKYILLTLGKEGIGLFEKGKKSRRLPTHARNVADVSGAGDTVISTLTMALSSKVNAYNSAYLANYAGGLVCEVAGIIPIEKEKLFETIENGMEE
ncbi:MAG: D-glycero-beta-D-manno-heptose-7-phosphate kinase [Melioribacteraceae bacterium]|nr:D-glycero-beta-D-manno-heptose-7-phosphate kinase [Melioribacteraceae bacterium]